MPLSTLPTLLPVPQAGHPLYNWRSSLVPGSFNSPPDAAIEFVSDLVREYRATGYRSVALGGLLKPTPAMPCGLKFGLSESDLDRFLTATHVDFVLGGLALSRMVVLQQHGVAADSTNWLWWSGHYDQARFGDRTSIELLQQIL